MKSPLKISRLAKRLIQFKLKAHLPDEMTGEQKLYAAVIDQAVRDLGVKSDSMRRQAWRFLHGDLGDINFVTAAAGIDQEYILRVIFSIPEHQTDIKKMINDILQRGEMSRDEAHKLLEAA